MSEPGRIIFVGDHDGIRGRLSNFATGSAVLKQEHRDFLHTEVVPILAAHGSLRLIELESRLGDSDRNKILSEHRLAAVFAFLRQPSEAGNSFQVTLDQPGRSGRPLCRCFR